MREKNSDEILNSAIDLIKSNKKVAIGTVVSTWGSSPRPVGSQIIIDHDGKFIGSVSGGCIEGAVVEEALITIKTGKSKLLEFGVSNEKAWESGLSCGGKIKVYIEQIK